MTTDRSATAAGTSRDWRTFEPVPLTPILAGALEAFYEHGYHGTTVRDIARRVGVTVPALYYHHPSKEALFVTLLLLGTDDVADRAEAAVADADDAVQALSNLTEVVVLHMTTRHKLAALDLEARYLGQESRARYAAPRRRIDALVDRVVADGVESGQFHPTDVHEAARALLGMWQSIARWFRDDGTLSGEEIAARYVPLSLATVGHGG
ncbi:AcrR family transcriptional regulator [Mumia flava]|uniref:AcrR family transcriptional regulator n=1 Tax=Mumia flava TaxID=1348852 RepID=A0A2M9AR81_9ACTN|nr:TetR/AcrR family transcriptional regulator [Mumia flava]PJJ48200.1 AcrR family transcriptional regulator [Mumia flava]